MVIAAMFANTTALADNLPQPNGEVVLTVTGAIGMTNSDEGARFDIPMLKALPQTKFTTGTIWTEDKSTFQGVLLKDLLEKVDAKGTMLQARALNDYAVEIPLTDAILGGPIIAYLNNGKTMSIREKGPLWIVYPYDAKSAYRTEIIYSRSIWQLEELTVTGD
ncbi:hypothetical protein Q669_32005 [Labrenzia sp. C1B10]|nr:hypothetical protein Q669_32005 [Labrenzia sp. C1B10]ERS04178.1 hypothetical protein Q675_30785 [Labrenzia sp. C1B70]